MRSEVLDATGVPAEVQRQWTEPPGSSPFFGWLDPVGDPSSIRYDNIVGLLRDARTGRFVILLQMQQACPTISDLDARRLMKRMGWKEFGQ